MLRRGLVLDLSVAFGTCRHCFVECLLFRVGDEKGWNGARGKWEVGMRERLLSDLWGSERRKRDGHMELKGK
jgi:hypothetical protein